MTVALTTMLAGTLTYVLTIVKPSVYMAVLDYGEMAMRTFEVIYTNAPHRNRRFKVRGICEYDVLNPCWDNRRDDIPGKHWGGGDACSACTEAATRKPQK